MSTDTTEQQTTENDQVQEFKKGRLVFQMPEQQSLFKKNQVMFCHTVCVCRPVCVCSW